MAWRDFEGTGAKLPVNVCVCYDGYPPAHAGSFYCTVHLCPCTAMLCSPEVLLHLWKCGAMPLTRQAFEPTKASNIQVRIM